MWHFESEDSTMIIFSILLFLTNNIITIIIVAQLWGQAQVLFPDVPLAVLSLREGAATEGASVAQPVTRHVARQS